MTCFIFAGWNHGVHFLSRLLSFDSEVFTDFDEFRDGVFVNFQILSDQVPPDFRYRQTIVIDYNLNLISEAEATDQLPTAD